MAARRSSGRGCVMTRRKPNLFLIGAMKSGTTYLRKLLKAHPDIFMCEPDEPSYFVDPRQLKRSGRRYGSAGYGEARIGIWSCSSRPATRQFWARPAPTTPSCRC